MRHSSSDLADAFLAAYIRRRAPVYFGGAPGALAEVRLLGTRVRPTSRLHQFGVQVGGLDRGVLVKATGSAFTPVEPGLDERPRDARPRIAPPPDARRSLRLEHEALSRIHDHVRRLGDPRFGAVRVLEWLPRQPAIVMELLDEPNLRALWLARPAGTPQRAPELLTAFRHAGAWLRAYHALPHEASPHTVQAKRDEFTHFVWALCTFLAGRVGSDRFFSRVATAADAAAYRHLPAALPTGLEHGDFAMRNVLVGEGQRVTVTDTRSLYRTSIYRDVGHFVSDLRCSVVPALGRGALGTVVRHADCRAAFLAGYFGEAVPEGAVALYEVQQLLERWAAAVERADARVRPAALRRAMYLPPSTFYRACIVVALRALCGPRSDEPALPAGPVLEETLQ